MVTATQLIEAFNVCFSLRFNTRLLGDADEPLYLPASGTQPALLFFRADYPSSALHEISHWCIAGKERRTLEDYGYWYEPDTRTEEQQCLFEQVEVKPQAIECIFHWAVGLPFRVSVDNFALLDYDARHFEKSVFAQVECFICSFTDALLPERAFIFSQYLLSQRCPDADFYGFMKQQYENHCR